jgi:hypothetical protein
MKRFQTSNQRDIFKLTQREKSKVGIWCDSVQVMGGTRALVGCFAGSGRAFYVSMHAQACVCVHAHACVVHVHAWFVIGFGAAGLHDRVAASPARIRAKDLWGAVPAHVFSRSHHRGRTVPQHQELWRETVLRRHQSALTARAQGLRRGLLHRSSVSDLVASCDAGFVKRGARFRSE